MIVRTRTVLFVAGILALLAMGLYASPGGEVPRDVTEDAKSDVVRTNVAELFEGRSSTDAYRAFTDRYIGRPVTEQHAAAHIFGEFLYRKDGIDGVVVCDGNFGFGCYHSLFGLALAERGPEAARELDERCFEHYGRLGTGCPHGIGHGLMWYFGDEQLDDALSFCDGMHYSGAIGGCTDGVFMEYNEHTMATGETQIGRRPYETSARHAPCSSVDARYTQACYYQQSAWWHRSLNGNASLAGSYCGEVKELDGRNACYRGLGSTLAIEAAYVPEAAIRACSAIGGSAEGRSLCIEGAAWMFLANPEHADVAHEVCAGEQNPTRCMEAAVIIR